jgi:hypothetical protein
MWASWSPPRSAFPGTSRTSTPVTHIALGQNLANLCRSRTRPCTRARPDICWSLEAPRTHRRPMLAARAAFRSGAGLVSIGGPKALTLAYANFPEVMTLGLGDTDQWSARMFRFPAAASVALLRRGSGTGPGPHRRGHGLSGRAIWPSPTPGPSTTPTPSTFWPNDPTCWPSSGPTRC